MLMVAGASPALVSSLLIHGDQFRVVRCLAFGQTIRCLSLSSHLSIGMQFKTRPSSPRCALLARSPSSQRAGLDSGCGTTEFHSRPATYSRSSVSFNAAADLMAPALSAGMLVGTSTRFAESHLRRYAPEPVLSWQLCIAPQFQPAMQASSHDRSAAFVCRAFTCCQSNIAVIDLPQILNPWTF